MIRKGNAKQALRAPRSKGRTTTARKRIGIGLACLLAAALTAVPAWAGGTYSYAGKSIAPAAGFGLLNGQDSPGFGTYYNFSSPLGAVPEGVPGGTFYSQFFATYVGLGEAYGTSTSHPLFNVGGTVAAFVPWGLYFYPWQPSDPHWRFANQFFMPILAAGPGSSTDGPQYLWEAPLAVIYTTSSDLDYLNLTVYSAPYVGIPVGEGFGFTTRNGVGNVQPQFTWIEGITMDLKNVNSALDGFEWEPTLFYTHQLRNAGLPGTDGALAPYLGAAGLPTSGSYAYTPGDSLVLENEITIPLSNLLGASRVPWSKNWRLGLNANWAGTVSNASLGHHNIGGNSNIEAVSLGPLLGYGNGPFTILTYMNFDVYDHNFVSEKQFFMMVGYFWS